MLPNSPAERAGIQEGDEILSVKGKDVKTLGEPGLRSAFNSIPSDGLPVAVKHKDGTILNVKLKEGAIYPPFQDFGPIE
jgi:S1-C subfamily serine protease